MLGNPCVYVLLFSMDALSCRAHNLSITGCRYSVAAKVLVTSSLDTEGKGKKSVTAVCCAQP